MITQKMSFHYLKLLMLSVSTKKLSIFNLFGLTVQGRLISAQILGLSHSLNLESVIILQLEAVIVFRL